MTRERKDLLIFGYGMAGILTIIAVRLLWKHGFGASQAALLTVAVVLAMVSVVNVEWLRPFYKCYVAVGRWLGEIVSGAILSVIFIGVFSISGVILRILRKDLLNQRMDPLARSYWIPRPDTPEDPERYTRQS